MKDINIKYSKNREKGEKKEGARLGLRSPNPAPFLKSPYRGGSRNSL